MPWNSQAMRGDEDIYGRRNISLNEQSLISGGLYQVIVLLVCTFCVNCIKNLAAFNIATDQVISRWRDF